MVRVEDVSIELGLDEVLVEHVLVAPLLRGRATPPALPLSSPREQPTWLLPSERRAAVEVGLDGER
jgi:hypothetical protein